MNVEALDSRPQILVVDDSPDNLLAYRTTLSGNYDVVMTSSGREALKYLMEQEFALILLDVVMPDMDGFETASLIRSRKKTSAVPIVFISAYPPDELQTFEGYATGAADFISTPLNPEILRSKVEAFINLYNFNRAKELLLQRELALEIERKESERQLLEAKRKAELLKQQKEYEARTSELVKQKSKELEQFAYVASHDLKAPLRTMSTYLDLFYSKYRGQIDKDADEYLQFVTTAAKKLSRLIDDLLSYSRLGTSGQKFQMGSLQRVVEDVLVTLTGQIAETGAEIKVDPLPTLLCDPTMLAQLFQNLISNALAYRGKNKPRIHISASEEKGRGWILSIKDNGMGFDMKYAEQIFEMFKSLHRQESGTGIGLAICRRIVERHGGSIWAKSKAGEGATFFFTLPLNPAVENLPLKGMKILLVDDAPDIRMVSSRILSFSGASCDVAEDGQAAVERAKEREYDVILMDIRMPGMDGYEAKDRIRGLGCQSPIVAFSTVEGRDTFAKNGFTDYLAKDKLQDSLLPFLEKYRPNSFPDRSAPNTIGA